jgi:hypothetical protein
VAAAGALLAAFPLAPSRGTARFQHAGLARLAAWVAVQLVVSSLVMTREILRRPPKAHPGVLAHRLMWPSEQTTYTAAAVILAADALGERYGAATPGSGIMRGTSLSDPSELALECGCSAESDHAFAR